MVSTEGKTEAMDPMGQGTWRGLVIIFQAQKDMI